VELDAQQYAPAFHELEISHQPLPAEPNFMLQAATGYVALGREQDARKALEQLQKLPLSDAQSIGTASLLLSIHENSSALKIVRALNRNRSAVAASWPQFDLALALLLSGSYAEAVDEGVAYTKTVHSAGAESMETAQAWSLIGIAKSAPEAWRRVRRSVAPKQRRSLHMKRALAESDARVDGTQPVSGSGHRNAKRTLLRIPNPYALRLRLGAAYLAAGRYAESESVFHELVTAAIHCHLGVCGLAQVLLRTGRAQEAATELADAEKKTGPAFLLSYFGGLALARAAKPEEALAAFQQAVQLDPKNAEAHAQLGENADDPRPCERSDSGTPEALRLDPGNTQAKRLLSQAYRRAGDAQNAAKYAEASAETIAEPANDLIGDFFVPEWRFPPGGTAEKGAMITRLRFPAG